MEANKPHQHLKKIPTTTPTELKSTFYVLLGKGESLQLARTIDRTSPNGKEYEYWKIRCDIDKSVYDYNGINVVSWQASYNMVVTVKDTDGTVLGQVTNNSDDAE